MNIFLGSSAEKLKLNFTNFFTTFSIEYEYIVVDNFDTSQMSISPESHGMLKTDSLFSNFLF